MLHVFCLRSPFQRGERPLPMAGLLGRWKVRVPGGLDEVALQQESYKKADHAAWSKERIQIHCMVRERQGELISVVLEGFASNYQSQFWNPNSILLSHQQVRRGACGKCTLTFSYSQWARTAQGFLACSMLRCLPLLPPPTSLHLGTTTCNPHLLVGCMVPWQEVETRRHPWVISLGSALHCSLKWLLIETALLQNVACTWLQSKNSQRNWKTACEIF